MRPFEFLNKNLLNTTTMVLTDSGTGTISYLYDRNTSLDYQSSGYIGASATTMNIVFDSPTVVSRILLQTHNLKQFKMYYNSNVANTFSNNISVATNSYASHYFHFNSVTVSSIQIQMDSTIDSNQEKQIGELVISDNLIAFDANPSAKNYEYRTKKKKIIHRMPDGGVSMFNVDNKFYAKMKLKFIGDTFKTSLLDIFNDSEQFYFVPEATTTSWNGVAHEVLWTNDWNFKHSEDSKSQGYDGDIIIEETPSS
ncbi:MAG: hypothetical protein KAJ48_09175 [Elusimicrobiales bacterium]|nr:hypothetical protein [Elusimicrobiales bacterium]